MADTAGAPGGAPPAPPPRPPVKRYRRTDLDAEEERERAAAMLEDDEDG